LKKDTYTEKILSADEVRRAGYTEKNEIVREIRKKGTGDQ